MSLNVDRMDKEGMETEYDRNVLRYDWVSEN
jgi:hypothetical protein